MDIDDGVEVVWNEVRYSNRKIARGSKVRAELLWGTPVINIVTLSGEAR